MLLRPAVWPWLLKYQSMMQLASSRPQLCLIDYARRLAAGLWTPAESALLCTALTYSVHWRPQMRPQPYMAWCRERLAAL